MCISETTKASNLGDADGLLIQSIQDLLPLHDLAWNHLPSLPVTKWQQVFNRLVFAAFLSLQFIRQTHFNEGDVRKVIICRAFASATKTNLHCKNETDLCRDWFVSLSGKHFQYNRKYITTAILRRWSCPDLYWCELWPDTWQYFLSFTLTFVFLTAMGRIQLLQEWVKGRASQLLSTKSACIAHSIS